MSVRDGYAKEQMTEVINDALDDNEVAERAVEALIQFYGDPDLQQRVHGGTRMDSRWYEHRLVFPWKDGVQ